MSLNDLVREGLIKPFNASQKQAADRLRLADRDIKTARLIVAQDRDWAFSIAYNAVLQASRALMFAMGYRPSGGEGQHVAAVRFAQEVLGKEFGEEIYIFEKMRSKRHKVIYDVSGLISQAEAKQAFRFAQKFVAIVKKRLEQIRTVEPEEKGR